MAIIFECCLQYNVYVFYKTSSTYLDIILSKNWARYIFNYTLYIIIKETEMCSSPCTKTLFSTFDHSISHGMLYLLVV